MIIICELFHNHEINMKLNKLCIALQSMVIGSMMTSISHANTTTDEPTATLDTIVIEASASASKDGLMNEFSGGQVAVGSRVGILGDKKTIDTPFSTVAYTNDYIQNQQADSVGDVLKKDPTVRVARGFGNFQETYFIRGFLTNSDDTMFNGLYGVLPRQYIASELFERVEVQRGASSALNGASSSGGNIGGTISLLPKRATNEPLKRVTVSTDNGENVKVALDVGQRYGKNGEFGVRNNVAYQTGGSAIDDEDKKLGLVAFGLDYRGDKLRVSSDLGYQNNQLDQSRPSIVATTFVPKPIKGSHNWAQKWTYSNEKDVFGTLRAEYDIEDNVTAYSAVGYLKGDEKNSLASLFTLNNADGSGTEYRFDNTRQNKVLTGDVGVKGKHQTGNISHDWVVSANYLDKKETGDWACCGNVNNNLYSPTYYNPYNTASSGKTDTQTITRSFAVADNLGFLDNRLNVLLAGRYQTLVAKASGNKTYDKSKFSPNLGILYKVTPEISVYGNYAESLAQGTYIVPIFDDLNVTNGGSYSEPFVSKQTEIGVKYDNGLIGASLAHFTTKKPNYDYKTNNDNTRTYVELGKDKHQGVELSVYGSPTANARVIGGLTYLNTSQGLSTDEKRVIGVPKMQANLGVEYDVTKFDGLTLTGDIIHTGNRYADNANTLKVDGYTTLDIGARYKTQIAGKDVTIKGVVANATDKKYWASVGGYAGNGYLTVGEPRTLKLSASFDF